MVEEKFSDITITPVFISKFKWTESYKAEMFAGHPIEGKVYRALYNSNSKNYKLHVPGTIDFLLFDSMSDKCSDYDSEFVEVTINNILDLDIKEEDLEQISIWIESSHNDIREMYEGKRDPLQPLTALIKAQNDQFKEDQKFMLQANKTIENLYIQNTIQTEVLLELANSLADDNIMSLEEDPLNLHEVHGLGVNIENANKALKRYTNRDKRTNENRSDIILAIKALIKELERRELNELD